MSVTAKHRARRGHFVPGPFAAEEEHSLGEEALHFTRWFLRSKYVLMAEFLGELAGDPAQRDTASLVDRYRRALRHAERVLLARSLVTILLALGVLAAATSAVANALGVAAPVGVLERAAAFSTSAAVLLVALRLLLDRYLERVDIAVTFLAIQLGSARARSSLA